MFSKIQSQKFGFKVLLLDLHVVNLLLPIGHLKLNKIPIAYLKNSRLA
jgi:hypothetical protein